MKLFTKLLAVSGLVVAFTLGFTLAALAEDAKVPEGKLAIHYYRADGKYDGWGAHVWESFQKKEEVDNPDAKKNGTDRTLPGVGWMSPLRPAGTDDFGAYWLIPANEFDNGKVNYIIHRGDSKDQGGKDMSWLIKNGKEIWVNAGDSNIYMSKDDAVKARK
jgi:Bacterial pullanase-associated domain